MITFGWLPTGRQVPRTTLPVLPGVLAHGSRDEDHGSGQAEAQLRHGV